MAGLAAAVSQTNITPTVKMACGGELEFEAPLAHFDVEDWTEFYEPSETSFVATNTENFRKPRCGSIADYNDFVDDLDTIDAGGKRCLTAPPIRRSSREMSPGSSGSGNFAEHFGDTCLSGSLEDLVNTFDESVTKCCKNYQEQVERLAPVQIRTEDDVIADCQ